MPEAYNMFSNSFITMRSTNRTIIFNTNEKKIVCLLVFSIKINHKLCFMFSWAVTILKIPLPLKYCLVEKTLITIIKISILTFLSNFCSNNRPVCCNHTAFLNYCLLLHFWKCFSSFAILTFVGSLFLLLFVSLVTSEKAEIRSKLYWANI